MKKIIALILTLTFALSVSACGSKPEEKGTSEVTTITTVNSYQKTDTIAVQDAIKLFKKDPYADVEGYVLDDSGWLSKEGEGSIGNIHTYGLENSDDIACLESYRSYAYSLDNNLLTKYAFGEMVVTRLIPEESIYCGLSEGNGFIFRKGDSVFCISLDLVEAKNIATGVKMVLDAEYEYNSDAWSQPLLLMEDGSVKAYVQWEEELMVPCYEGGYGGTYIE